MTERYKRIFRSRVSNARKLVRDKLMTDNDFIRRVIILSADTLDEAEKDTQIRKSQIKALQQYLEEYINKQRLKSRLNRLGKKKTKRNTIRMPKHKMKKKTTKKKSLSDMTMKQLKEKAKKRGVRTTRKTDGKPLKKRGLIMKLRKR